MEENGNVHQKILVSWFYFNTMERFYSKLDKRNPLKNQGVTYAWSLADRETRSNRNRVSYHIPIEFSLADRETRSNRNVADRRPRRRQV